MIDAKDMFEVKAMLWVPRMAMNYDQAHVNMSTLAEKVIQMPLEVGDPLGISFRDTETVHHSYLFGLAEYINEHNDFNWMVQHTTHPDRPFDALKRLAGSTAKLTMATSNTILYVKKAVVPFKGSPNT